MKWMGGLGGGKQGRLVGRNVMECKGWNGNKGMEGRKGRGEIS